MRSVRLGKMGQRFMGLFNSFGFKILCLLFVTTLGHSFVPHTKALISEKIDSFKWQPKFSFTETFQNLNGDSSYQAKATFKWLGKNRFTLLVENLPSAFFSGSSSSVVVQRDQTVCNIQIGKYIVRCPPQSLWSAMEWSGDKSLILSMLVKEGFIENLEDQVAIMHPSTRDLALANPDIKDDEVPKETKSKLKLSNLQIFNKNIASLELSINDSDKSPKLFFDQNFYSLLKQQFLSFNRKLLIEANYIKPRKVRRPQFIYSRHVRILESSSSSPLLISERSELTQLPSRTKLEKLTGFTQDSTSSLLSAQGERFLDNLLQIY